MTADDPYLTEGPSFSTDHEVWKLLGGATEDLIVDFARSRRVQPWRWLR